MAFRGYTERAGRKQCLSAQQGLAQCGGTCQMTIALKTDIFPVDQSLAYFEHMAHIVLQRDNAVIPFIHHGIQQIFDLPAFGVQHDDIQPGPVVVEKLPRYFPIAHMRSNKDAALSAVEYLRQVAAMVELKRKSFGEAGRQGYFVYQHLGKSVIVTVSHDHGLAPAKAVPCAEIPVHDGQRARCEKHIINDHNSSQAVGCGNTEQPDGFYKKAVSPEAALSCTVPQSCRIIAGQCASVCTGKNLQKLRFRQNRNLLFSN